MYVGNKLVVNIVGWGCIIFLVFFYMEYNIFVFFVYFEIKCCIIQIFGLILVWGIFIVIFLWGFFVRDNIYVKYGVNFVLFFFCLDKVYKQVLLNGLKFLVSLIFFIVVYIVQSFGF